MNNKIIACFPILFILAIWFIFASPFFLKGKVPFPSTYQVNHFPPWSSYPENWGPVKNNAMPDVIGQIYPWKNFTIETFKKGHIPFWNPNSFAGNPHLANFQSAVLSPFNLLFFVLPFINAWSILVLLQPLLAGLFMYLFLRILSISKIGALIGSVAYMFCGFITVWMAYGTLSMTAAFLPILLYTVEKVYKKLSFFHIIILAILISITFFSGHFQIGLYIVGYAFTYFLFKAISTKKTTETRVVFLGFFIGIIISLLQIIPSVQLYSHSVRSEIFNSAGGIPFYYLITLFIPDFFGNPVTRNDWIGSYAEWASFIGIIPFTLALYAIGKKKKINSYFFLYAFLLSFILATASPLQSLLSFLKIPVISTSIPSRIIILCSFSLAVLAGFGLDNLNTLLRKEKLLKIIRPLTFVWILFILIWVIILVTKIMPVDKMLIAKRNFLFPSLLLAMFSIGVVVSYYRKKFIIPIFFIFLIAVSFDSLRFAQKWMPFDPKNLVFPDTKIIRGIQENIGFGRVFGNFGASVDTYYNVAGIEGYDPLYIKRYGEFIRSAGRGEFTEAERSVVGIDRNGAYTDRVLDLLGVNLIFHPIADTNQSWAYPVWKDRNRFVEVFKDSKFQLFKNNSALERATLFYEYDTITNDRQIINTLYSKDFDFRKRLILEEKVSGIGKEGTGSAQIITYEPDFIKINVTTSEPALLFLSDNFYPGWKATVNGVNTKILRADYTFRAVKVPKGQSVIEFSYNPYKI